MEQQTRSSIRNERNEESNLDKAMATAKEKTQPVKDKANEIVDETKSKFGDATDQAKSALASQKDEAAGQLHGLAQALRETGDQLRDQDEGGMFASYSNQVADQIDRVSGYLQDRDMNDLMHDAEDFARRQPELFIGGAFTLGLLAARFMKSSSPETNGRRSYADTRRRNTTAVPQPRVRFPEDRQETVGERPYYSTTKV
ncbi:MAG: hypothetical protein KC441_14005 [Anaerolineales bacterium]|nr:hypothetical protein [Anaerolineales bacterium]